MHNPPNETAELVRHEVAYQGYFKVGRYFFRHSLHRGGLSSVISREVFERGQAGAVLPYDPARDEVVLIRQFRAGSYVAGHHPFTWEVVAGISEANETAEARIRREAIEEANLQIAEAMLIANIMLTPGACSESCQVFLGRIEAANDLAGLRAGAGSEHDVGDQHRLRDLQVGLLDRFAPDHRLGRLVRLDDARHHLPGERMVAGDVGAGAELSNQHDLVTSRIGGQHGAGLPALDHLATDHAAHPAPVQAMAEEVASDFEVTLVAQLLAHQFGRLVGRVRHRGLSAASRGRASSS